MPPSFIMLSNLMGSLFQSILASDFGTIGNGFTPFQVIVSKIEYENIKDHIRKLILAKELIYFPITP